MLHHLTIRLCLSFLLYVLQSEVNQPLVLCCTERFHDQASGMAVNGVDIGETSMKISDSYLPWFE